MMKWLAVAVATACLSGCTDVRQSSPVFGAVFGLSGAAVTPYTQGKVPEDEPRPDDRLVGRAANNPGLCIYADAADRRFRAPCPQA